MYSGLVPEMLGQPETALLNFYDITDLKNVERNLRQREEQLKELANSIPQLAWIAEPNGDIFWYNDRWYDYPQVHIGTVFCLQVMFKKNI